MNLETKFDEADNMINKFQSKNACRYPLDGQWQFRQQGNDTWLPATVPGCNFTDLLANEVIDDPFYRNNESSLQWIELENWHYRKHFTLSEELLNHTEIELIAEGMDTFCDIFINGEKIYECNNMFIGYRINCKKHLNLGDNLIEIHFRSPIKEVMPSYLAAGYAYPAENDKSDEKLSVYCRKAPCHFGWDWGPRFITSGIWRNIYLQTVKLARFEDVCFSLHHLTDNIAEFSFTVETLILESFVGQLRINCTQAPELNLVRDLNFVVAKNKQQSNVLDINFCLSNPKRWWPNGLGEAFLYHFTFELISNDQIVSTLEQKVGLRTLEVINEKDSDGECFFLRVNGHQVFMKGANYIPADSFLHRVTPQKHQDFFAATKQANMNMLRVWGGGVYQDDIFYQMADEYGILIWQDFMFACTLYPADDDFIKNVQQEAHYNIRRLRNHPSIALWCGNNEVDMAIKHWHWPEKFGYSEQLFDRLKKDYMHLFDKCLRDAVSEHDPERFYLRSSPIGSWESDEDHTGNHHYWGVWHGEEPFKEYQKRIPRFMSEYGFQSFPLSPSLQRFTKPEDRQLESPVMQVHQKHPRGNSLIHRYLEQEFKAPKDFESLLYISQIQQALGLKLAFEAHRKAMPFCMGSLYWQLNDTWPAASWSGIDYYGKWKALHYQAKRSFDEQVLIINHDSENINISIVSDKLTSFDAQLELALIGFDGILQWSYVSKIKVKANCSQHVLNIPSSKLLDNIDLAKTVLTVSVNSSDDNTVYCDNNHFFLPNNQLELSSPELDVTHTIKGNLLELTLNSNNLIRQIYLDLTDVEGNFSDNFFDLIPGRTKTINMVLADSEIENGKPFLDRLTWMSLYDSFAKTADNKNRDSYKVSITEDIPKMEINS